MSVVFAIIALTAGSTALLVALTYIAGATLNEWGIKMDRAFVTLGFVGVLLMIGGIMLLHASGTQ